MSASKLDMAATVVRATDSALLAAKVQLESAQDTVRAAQRDVDAALNAASEARFALLAAAKATP